MALVRQSCHYEVRAHTHTHNLRSVSTTFHFGNRNYVAVSQESAMRARVGGEGGIIVSNNIRCHEKRAKMYLYCTD